MILQNLYKSRMRNNKTKKKDLYIKAAFKII